MTEEQQALLTKARRSVRIARVIAGEGEYDFAVSRTYDAMFYTVRALLLEKDLTFSRHFAVIGSFGREFARASLVPQEFRRFLVEAQEN